MCGGDRGISNNTEFITIRLGKLTGRKCGETCRRNQFSPKEVDDVLKSPSITSISSVGEEDESASSQQFIVIGDMCV